MSRMSDLIIEIQEAVKKGELSFAEIATRYDVPVSWVDEVAMDLADQYDESMDGDHASALASAGWGTDEDYVIDNDYFDDY